MTLREARILARYKLKDAAKYIGVSVPTLYNWEHGKGAPNIVIFRKLCSLYQVESDDIFFDGQVR